MKQVHVECKPDEILVSKLGYGRGSITHHQGKSRVFHRLRKKENQLAVVDEDPGSSKTSYEKSLKFVVESYGVKYFEDGADNKVFILKGKLEDWIIHICKQYKIDISKYNLPDKPNALHEVMNQRLQNFERLLDDMI